MIYLQAFGGAGLLWGVIGEGCRKDECQILSVVTGGLLKIVSSLQGIQRVMQLLTVKIILTTFAQLIFNYWGGYEQIFFTKDQIVILRKYAHSIDCLPHRSAAYWTVNFVGVINKLSSEEEKANL